MNPKSIKKRILLTSDLNMSQNKARVDDAWNMFEDNNSPIFNDSLSPLFYTKYTSPNEKVTDRDGNVYEIKEGGLFRNDTRLMNISDTKFTKTEINADLIGYYEGHIYKRVGRKLYKDNVPYLTLPDDNEIYVFDRFNRGLYFKLYKTIGDQNRFYVYGENGLLASIPTLFFNAMSRKFSLYYSPSSGKYYISFLTTGATLQTAVLNNTTSGVPSIVFDTNTNTFSFPPSSITGVFIDNNPWCYKFSTGWLLSESHVWAQNIETGETKSLNLGLEGGHFHSYYSDIGTNFIRFNGIITNVLEWKSFCPIANCQTIMFDSLMNECLVNAGTTPTSSDTNTYTGFRFPNHNPLGGKKIDGNTTSFKILTNNGFVSGISCADILLTDWNSIDTESDMWTDSDYAYYRDGYTNKWILLQKATGNEMKILYDRYIVINTTSFWNCWDIQLNEKEHYASDWNNRIFPYGDTSMLNQTFILGSGHNVSYDVISKTSGISSTVWSAPVLQCASNLNLKIYDDQPYKWPIDIYWSVSTSKAPLYVKTSLRNTFYVDGSLDFYKPSYPLYNGTSMRRSPTIFTRFIYSGNNNDYMTVENRGYPILYENSIQPILLSSTTGDLYNVDAVFVIQSMPFAIIDEKIYELSYLNGIYQGKDCIIDIKGMKFIGSVPTRAFFWSPINKALFCFTGDANLTKVKDASIIDDIYYTGFNTATQTIYFATNNGLYLQNDVTSYRLPYYNVRYVSWEKDGTIDIVDGNDLWRLDYKDIEGKESNKVILDTGLYGAGNNQVFTVDKWSIDLFSRLHRNGSVKCRSYILTDNGHIEEEFEEKVITKSDWDPVFNSAPVSFTPRKNKGIGVGLMIESDFAIHNITASATINQETQAARLNF